jgi:AmpD protein
MVHKRNPVHIDASTGLLREARQVPSPNCDDRPAGAAVELLVIHAISLPEGEFGGPWIDHLFCNQLQAADHPEFAAICQLQVSAHVLIRRDGELVQYVPFHRRAWHAGVSQYAGREACNDFSIGIELEGCDDQAFTERQYDTLGHLCQALLATYPSLSPRHIAGHSDIAPGRKTDPGPHFDWTRLRATLQT